MKLLVTIFLLTSSLGTVRAESVRILTYNIFRKPEPFGFGGTQAARRVKHLCKILKDTSYDAILMQEAWLAKDRKNLEKCGYPYVLNLGTVRTDLPGRAAASGREQNLESGLLILSKHPFVAAKRWNYGERGTWWHVFSDGETLVSKAAYAGQIELASGRRLWLVNTHLAANYCSSYPRVNCVSYEDERAAQLEELSAHVLSLDGPVVVGGDFNMGPSLISRDMAWERFDDYFPGFAQASYDPNRHSTSSIYNNFNYFDMGKIDHLFGSRELRAQDGSLVFNQLMNIDNRSMHLSDHFGWETTFYFD